MSGNLFDPTTPDGSDDLDPFDPTRPQSDHQASSEPVRPERRVDEGPSSDPQLQATPSRPPRDAGSGTQVPAPAEDIDTSELTFGSVFDNIAGVNQYAQAAQRDLPEEAMAEIEVSGDSPNGVVQVTFKDAVISSLTVSQQWLDKAHSREVERELIAVLNDTLTRYNEVVMRGLQQATPEMSEVTRMIDAVRAQVRGAFDAEMTRIGNESRRS